MTPARPSASISSVRANAAGSGTCAVRSRGLPAGACPSIAMTPASGVVTVIVAGSPAATVVTVARTWNAAVAGRLVTVAGAPTAAGVTVRSTRLSFTMIGERR